ncbi:MAG: fimbrillin family protein, partial [Bacteroidales bacterium]|nr:fimbrillin family protein [Bacteroidales bacterium]
NGISVTPASNAAPTATVTIKDGQVDFLTAKSENLEDNPDFTALNVTLSFSHALAGIRFKCNDGVTVESVTISGVNNKGTYSFTDNTWSGQEVSGANTYTLTGITYDAASDGYKTFKLEHTLFMLPQTLPAGSRIAVKIAGKSVVVEVGMVGHVWDSGKCITYLINSLPDGSVTLSIDSVTSFSNVASDITAGGGNVNEFNDDDDGILIW